MAMKAWPSQWLGQWQWELINMVEQAAEYSIWKPKVDTTFRVQPQQPSPASELQPQGSRHPRQD